MKKTSPRPVCLRALLARRRALDAAIVAELARRFPEGSMVYVFLSSVQRVASVAVVIGWKPDGQVRVRLVDGKEIARDVPLENVHRSPFEVRHG